MTILNFSTKIDVERTSGEIQKMLSSSGAQAVMCEYDPHGVMCAMSFRSETPYGIITFRLPAQLDGVFKLLCESKNSKLTKKTRSREQAAKVAWRILKDWIEAQLAIIEAGMAEMAEVFLPYAQDSRGETVYKKLKSEKFKLLN